MKKIFLILCLGLSGLAAEAQFTVTADTLYAQMVNNFILSGVTATNVAYTGAPFAAGTFTGGALTNLGLSDGLILTTGRVDTAAGQPNIGDSALLFKSSMNNTAGSLLLDQLIPGFNTFDASVLEFDLVPAGNVLEFQYVFASEEYPEFVGSSFNDVFGFFISGPSPLGGAVTDSNIALLPVSGDVVSINNVNAGLNASYFVDNLGLNGGTIVFDGFTTVLLAQINVIPGASYHLVMAVADAGDGVFDSGVFLKAQSMKSYMLTAMEEHEGMAASLSKNPVDDQTVLTVNDESAGQISLRISDRTGRLVFEKITSKAAGALSLPLGSYMSELPSGIYFISVSSPEGNAFSRAVKP